MAEDQNWDLEMDVVVLGSGGAKDVVILEKSGMVGTRISIAARTLTKTITRGAIPTSNRLTARWA